MKLSDIREEALIERIINDNHLPRSGEGLTVGVGDDAAVLSADAQGMLTIITTDMLTERMDYRDDLITPYQLGWKSVAVNISDIAAMGGSPTWTLVSLGFRPDTDVSYVEAFYRGITACAAHYGSTVIGGDMNAVIGDNVISITQLGRVEPGKLALRSGAKVGDHLLVTGLLGESRAGLELLLKYGLEESINLNEPLVQVHVMPFPRVFEAVAAVGTGAVHAMMDISDGLGADLPKLCKSSGVGALVCSDRLPISEDLKIAACTLDMQAIDLAAGGGEDFELLMAVPPDAVETVINAVQSSTGTGVTEIGEITGNIIKIAYPDGTKRPLHGGWEHFS
ncbi:MAG: thiamine-phosphate kinase [Armatimonadota bacterium]